MPDRNRTLFQIPEITDYHYRFYNHFHPYVGHFIEKLNKGNLEDLLDIETQRKSSSFFAEEYTINPEDDEHLFVHYYDKKVDFAVEDPYSIYNWELFFHIPLAIAVQLTKNQRFADAQRWFHFIFNPLTDKEEGADDPSHTARFWNFLPFHIGADAENITTLLENLSPSEGEDAALEELRERTKLSVEAWRKAPFQPHEVAKFRPLSYQFHVVMKYLDMLIAWGDSLFRQFTIETINHATQVYVVAKNILGPRPQQVPRLNKRPIKNYMELKDQLDEFGNALVEMENEFPLYSNVPSENNTGQDATLTSLLGIGKQLFFCVPHNEELMKYWDIIDDRLFKIRNCMDIEGNVRQLPLFQPPIDPGMLVKAAAGGMSIGDIVGGLNQPVSNVRFSVIFQKALELVGELKALGNALLSAIEKGENEKLALIRQEHEIKILELTQDFKYLQWKEAEASTEALLKSRESAFQRFRHFQLLLGKEEGDLSDYADISLERPSLSEENFEDVYANLVEKYGQEIDLEEYREERVGLLGEAKNKTERATGVVAKVSRDESSNNLQLNKAEDLGLNVLMPSATIMSLRAGRVSTIANLLALIPNFSFDAKPLGIGGGFTYGGQQLSTAVSFASQLIRLGSEIMSYQANRASSLASYQQRIRNWVQGNNQASKELEQIGKQIITSLIREQSLKKDYENHKVQIEQSKAVDEFIRTQKFSNEGLYLWMQGELSKIYYDCYKLAFDTAKKAEITMKHELMRDDISERDFIKFNYWDAGRKGLLSGEALFMDLKRMELAYLESNKREFELTKHISLEQLNPLALMTLKTTGTCMFEIPEWVFDLDCPGHYMRRIKTVSLSIPCVTGPYTSVNCTLSLEKSSIRVSPLLSDDNYARASSGEDTRFKDYYGAIQSIVTSNAQNDSGLFEVNLREERFLPFENSGAVSTWKLELPSEHPQFDYDSISDVVLHLQYTARQGGQILKDKANTHIDTIINDFSASGLTCIIDFKKEFPNELHQFIAGKDVKIQLTKKHFPFFLRGKDLKITSAKYLIGTEGSLDWTDVGNTAGNNIPLELALRKTDNGTTIENVDILEDNIIIKIEYIVV